MLWIALIGWRDPLGLLAAEPIKVEGHLEPDKSENYLSINLFHFGRIQS
jgi:hypothetical protein